MKIQVIAPFEIQGLDADGFIELPPGTRVRDVLKRTKPIVRFFVGMPVMVNGKQVKKSCELQDGDVLMFLFPLSGG
jgi:hypothetical protein